MQFSIPSQCQKDGAYLESLGWIAIVILLLLTLLLVVLRHVCDRYLCPHLCQKWTLKSRYHDLLPETFWKCGWSLLFFVWSSVAVLVKYPYFFRVETVWFAETSSSSSSSSAKDDGVSTDHDKDPTRAAWQPGMPVPWDLRGLFLLLLAFYAHAIFAMYFQDRDRDFDYVDFFTRTRICLLHHAATLILM